MILRIFFETCSVRIYPAEIFQYVTILYTRRQKNTLKLRFKIMQITKMTQFVYDFARALIITYDLQSVTHGQET